METGSNIIKAVLDTFTGRDGEPANEVQIYTLKAMWLMMLSEFEASIKSKVEEYIDRIKGNSISDIHVCLLIRNFLGEKKDELTPAKIVSYFKKNPSEISYTNFTRDRVPKYKSKAIEKLFNNLGIFFEEEELTSLSLLNGIAQTRDSIAHGDHGVQITRSELEDKLVFMQQILIMLDSKLS